ncbi:MULTISPECIES: cyclic nucleotide-binding/CBS domain-containing protein [Halorussus]|uniref:CBS domain-containing protein n=1 Tax=Halorussus TaxID=1070314 RepID=UPI0020A142FD|nr:CBS domain-containing protein [Halorussus vallis]USZ76602.1 CBS domain-containing protein [Halorussus vallis]
MEREVTVRDVMTREYVGVNEGDSVLGTVELMCEEGVGSVVVLRGSDPVGIVTESDVLELVAARGDPAATAVGEVMSEPVISMEADRGLSDAAGTMSRNDIRRILVTVDGELVGVVDERDVISASASLSGVPSPNDDSREIAEQFAAGSGPGTDAGGGSGPDARSNPVGNGEISNDERAEYSDRSICETCGTLSRELSNVNGQLICANCREV